MNRNVLSTKQRSSRTSRLNVAAVESEVSARKRRGSRYANSGRNKPSAWHSVNEENGGMAVHGHARATVRTCISLSQKLTETLSRLWRSKMKTNLISLLSLVLILNFVSAAHAGLRAHWAMDESPGATTAADSSGMGNPGNVLGNATFAAGRIGNALSLDGSSGSYVDVPPDTGDAFDAFNLGEGDFTFALWANLSSTNHIQNTLSFGDVGTLGGGVAEMVQLVDGRLIGAYAAHNPVGPPAIAADRSIIVPAGTPTPLDPTGNGTFDRWAHLAMTRDVGADEFKLYLDGELIDTLNSVAGDMSFQNDTWGVIIGRGFFDAPNPNERPVVGLIDDVRIYDEALTQAQIRSLPGGVPEPTSFVLLGLGGLMLLIRRR